MPYLDDIVKKALNNVEELDIDSTNYDHVEFEISANEQQLYITRYYGYEQPGDGSGMTWGDDTDDTELVERIISEIKESEAKSGRDGIVKLDVAGSGDRG